MSPLRQLAERTPAQRDRYVDLLSALAYGVTAAMPRLLRTVAGYVAAIPGPFDKSLISRTGHETLDMPHVALTAFLAGALTLRPLRPVPDAPRSVRS